MKKITLVLVSLFLLTTIISAQNTSLQDAFKNSYELEKEGEYSKAINALKKVYDDNSYELNLRLGWLHYSSGLFTEAAAYYQKGIELKPLSIEARLGYALPTSALGNWEQVLTTYKAILQIDPNHSTTNYRIGLIFYGRQDYKTAERYFEKVLNSYPFDYDSLLMLGWTKYFLGKRNEAKVLFNKVLLYSPEDDSALEGLDLVK